MSVGLMIALVHAAVISLVLYRYWFHRSRRRQVEEQREAAERRLERRTRAA